MTPWEIRDAVARVSYKDWSITVEHDEFIGARLRVVYTEPDNYMPGHTIDIGFSRQLPPIPDEAYLFRFVLDRLIEAEIHEARERFFVDDHVFSNPHGEERAA